jgi:hypothetical protein
MGGGFCRPGTIDPLRATPDLEHRVPLAWHASGFAA